MIAQSLLLAGLLIAQGAGDSTTDWKPFTSQEGKFVIDFPAKPSTSSRQMRTKSGMLKIVVVTSSTPDIAYVAQKLELPQAANLKTADIEAILESFRDDISKDLNGKVIAEKKIRLGGDSPGIDFTIEARPNPKQGISTIRVREYLSQKILYILLAETKPDKDLPDDVGHFFASFAPGTKRVKKMGPHPEPDGKPLGDWGTAIDPDNDCKIDDKGKTLEISIPNTHHDLNADNDKLNAPRVVREVTGDFTMTVKVSGDLTPSEKSTNPKAVPYVAGGIVIWQDSDNYIFLGRAAMNRKGKINEIAAFEEREWGSRGAVNNQTGIDPGPFYVRVERRNNRILGSISKDGKSWKKLEGMEPTYPSTVKVGLYSINGSTSPSTVTFEDFSFNEGKPEATGKAKAKKKGR